MEQITPPPQAYVKEHDFMIDIPTTEYDVNRQEQKQPDTYSTKVCYVLKRAWNSIESLSEFVTDFLGITAPRYEMFIDDSIEYLAQQEAEAYQQKEREQAGVLMEAIQ